MTISLIVSGNVQADDSREGVYAVCEPWTTINGVQTSNLFELELKEMGVLEFRTSFFSGNQECVGQAMEVRRVWDLLTVENLNGRIITAISASSKLYYRALFGRESVLLLIGEKLPSEIDIEHLPLALERVKKRE
jgi:hypothetical protein